MFRTLSHKVSMLFKHSWSRTVRQHVSPGHRSLAGACLDCGSTETEDALTHHWASGLSFPSP